MTTRVHLGEDVEDLAVGSDHIGCAVGQPLTLRHGDVETLDHIRLGGSDRELVAASLTREAVERIDIVG